MSDNTKTMDEIKARLTSLEKQVFELQKENFSFKKEVYKLNTENSKLKEDLSSQAVKLEKLEKRVPKLAKKATKTEKQSIALGTQVDAIFTKTEAMHEDVTQMSALRKVLCRSMVAGQSNNINLSKKVERLEGRMDDIGLKTRNLERANDTFRQSVTAARLEPTGGLVVGRSVKVDRCMVLEGSPGLMDEATGCLGPKRKGRYVVGLRMAQKGDGVIMVNLKWDGEDIGSTMVRTVRDDDLKSGLHVLEMKEGGKYWLEAKRVKGKAEILWCNVYCWFLSPC